MCVLLNSTIYKTMGFETDNSLPTSQGSHDYRTENEIQNENSFQPRLLKSHKEPGNSRDNRAGWQKVNHRVIVRY